MKLIATKGGTNTMAINIEALINSLGKTYQEIFDMGLIPYKTKPTGSSGDPYISLEMAKEGMFLSFKRDSRIFVEMTLRMLDEKNLEYRFPNELPSPLLPEMNRQWLHDHLGKPEKSHPPEVFMKRQFGWTELYMLLDFHMPMSMQVSYDLRERAKSITFLPTSEVRW